MTQTTGRRFEIGLLWKDQEVQLAPTYEMAVNRFLIIRRKLNRDPDLHTKYTERMEHYLNSDLVCPIPRTSSFFYAIDHTFSMSRHSKCWHYSYDMTC